MPPTTPAELALELNVSAKRVRDVLRDVYGTLPEGVSRWELTDVQDAAVRQRLSAVGRDAAKVWSLEPGDTVRRGELHQAYGGSRQNGIVTSRAIRDIIAFTDPRSGSRYGYDAFEGLREDGSYGYTGEGQRGHQRFVRGNRAIRDAARDGRPVRLFTVNGTMVTYVGEFTTGTPTCSIQTIPDIDGNPREGIIFNLIPVDADSALLATEIAPSLTTAQVVAWSPPDATDVVIVDSEPAPPGDRVVSRLEFALQADFGDWLRAQGHAPRRLLLSSHGVTIEPDLYAETTGWVVEAKRSSGREHVRMAIGQVLDYVHVARAAEIEADPVVLLPGRPTPDLVALLHSHQITLAVRGNEGFDILPPAAGVAEETVVAVAGR